jgi:hypothetical protein
MGAAALTDRGRLGRLPEHRQYPAIQVFIRHPWLEQQQSTRKSRSRYRPDMRLTGLTPSGIHQRFCDACQA